MTFETSISQMPELHYASFFEALAGNNALLKPDAPRFTILAASPSYLKQTGYSKENLVGQGIFEAFPGSNDPGNTGVGDLQASLEFVLRNKVLHELPVQRYDTAGEDGVFVERYWQASNKPVFTPDGELAFIIHSAEDITDLVKAKKREAQIENIEKTFNLFMQVPAIISITRGPNHVLELVNEGALELWGKDDNIIGKPLLDAIPEIQGQGIVERFDEVMKTGKRFSDSEVAITTNRKGRNEELYFDVVYQPYYEKDAAMPAGVFTISHEVTELVKANRKLEESEARFRSMADASPVMIWTLDENGNSSYYNNRASEFTGHSEEEIREGKSWQVAIHPDDIEDASRIVSNAVANRMPYQMECRMQRADGEWRWLLNQGTPRFGSEGEYFGYVGSSIDITEHKKAEQELQTVLEQVRLSKEAAELGTFDMEVQENLMHWDDRCRILFGISHKNTVSFERDFIDRLHPDDQQRVLNGVHRAYDKAQSNGDYDVEYRTIGADDGSMRWVRAKGKVYFNEKDQPVRFIGSVLDISEQKMAIHQIESLVDTRTKELAHANESLLKMNKELQRSNQNLEEFAHAASHDLKEPVRKIHFFTHQLKDQLAERLKQEEIRSFNRIENATERMGNLIDDLLLYSHVSQRPHDTEAVDLNQKIQRVLEDLDLDVEEKKAVVTIEKLPIINGYGRQLQQLFQNLISNSLKYSKAEVPPVIEITAQIDEIHGRNYHVISVKDNGIGFEQQYEDKIFQMFARLHGKSEYSGTGVGLSIVKKVAENHNGFVRVKSEENVGSLFRIYLPA